MKFLLETLLKLTDISVKNCQSIDGIGLIISVETDLVELTCPTCGRSSRSLHQNKRRLVRDLPISGTPVWLRVNCRQFKCKNCQKPFSEQLEWVERHKSYTKRLAKAIVKEVLDSNIHSVARRNDLTAEEVESMLKIQIEQLEKIDKNHIERLGIDEIALTKRKGNYVGVLVNLDNNCLIDLVKSRKQASLREIFTSWGSDVLCNIKEVSIDLWKQYKDLVEELMPNAAVTADRFHVMNQVTEELDEERRRAKKAVSVLKDKSEKEKKLEAINKSKYALLKNKIDLNQMESSKLQEIKVRFPKLGEMHRLKEKLRSLYEAPLNWVDGAFMIMDWLEEAEPYFPNSVRTIVRWFGEVIGYFEHRTTSGPVEGINNKLKLIKRAGYGFTNFDNFRLRSLLTWYFQ